MNPSAPPAFHEIMVSDAPHLCNTQGGADGEGPAQFIPHWPLCHLIPISFGLPTWVQDLGVLVWATWWPILGGELNKVGKLRTGWEGRGHMLSPLPGSVCLPSSPSRWPLPSFLGAPLARGLGIMGAKWQFRSLSTLCPSSEGAQSGQAGDRL